MKTKKTENTEVQNIFYGGVRTAIAIFAMFFTSALLLVAGIYILQFIMYVVLR